MKMKAISKIKSEAEARQIAIDWQSWQSIRSMSYAEVAKWQDYFRKLGKKFKISQEFKENAII